MSVYQKAEEHKLVIESLRDGKAHCTCGGWYYSATGGVCYQEVFYEFNKHGAPVPKNGAPDANCGPAEELTDVDLTANGFVLG